MSAFYDRMASTALRLIERFGQSITISRIVPGEYDPETGETSGDTTESQAGQAVLMAYTAKDAGEGFEPGTLIRAGDKKVMLAAKDLSWAPAAGDTVLAQGVTWQIVNVKANNPAGTPLTYEMQARK